MNTRTKIAASGLLIAAFAAAATPVFANDSTTVTGKVAAKGLHHDGMKKQHDGPLAALVTAGTITQAQADSVETATRTAMTSAESANFNAALAALVANNTISQDLATAAKASITADGALGRHARPDLGSWTDAQRTALHTWLDAHPIDRATIGKTAITNLVTAGTITQTQANAVDAAFIANPPQGPKHGPRHGMGRGRH